MYGPLRDPCLFNQVALDTEIGTLVWPSSQRALDWIVEAVLKEEHRNDLVGFIEMASHFQPLSGLNRRRVWRKLKRYGNLRYSRSEPRLPDPAAIVALSATNNWPIIENHVLV